MASKIKKNISLILGIAIPILMILFVAGSIYLPSFFAQQPKVDFLYTDGDYYYDGAPQYSVQNGKLVKNKVRPPENGKYAPPLPRVEPKLFIHDTAKNENREVSFDEAQKLSIDSNAISPDGFEIVCGSRGDNFFPFFFFSETDCNARYLKGHNISKRVILQSNGSYYNSYNFRFLGWIKN